MDPKKVIRNEVIAAMSPLSAGARSAAALTLASQVRRVIADRQPGCVMGFLADDREIDFDPAITELLMNPRMILGVPIVSVDQGRMTCGRLTTLQTEALVTDRYGIRTPRPPADPIEPATLDLIFVPGVAFTSDGRRLGRGAGTTTGSWPIYRRPRGGSASAMPGRFEPIFRSAGTTCQSTNS